MMKHLPRGVVKIDDPGSLYLTIHKRSSPFTFENNSHTSGFIHSRFRRSHIFAVCLRHDDVPEGCRNQTPSL
jgi:hypothetical protein